MKIQTHSMVQLNQSASRLWQHYVQRSTGPQDLRGQYAPEYPMGQVFAFFNARKLNVASKHDLLKNLVPE